MLLVGSAPSAIGQEVGRVEQIEAAVAPYYIFARPGAATTQVYVWGSVRAPGLYEVDADMGLGQLITIAGGPPQGPGQEGVEQRVTFRLYREVDGARDLVYEAPLADFIERPGAYPQLRDGDVLVVEAITQRPSFTWRDALSVTTAVLALAIAVDRLFGSRR